MRIISPPKISTFLAFSNSLIKERKNNQTQIKIYEQNFLKEYHVIFPINIRECLPGEIYLPNLLMYYLDNIIFKKFSSCKKCDYGEYSLSTSDKECKSCVENSECPGGNAINIQQGFWRSGLNSIIIYNCLSNFENCL